jgi:hypothetical protein
MLLVGLSNRSYGTQKDMVMKGERKSHVGTRVNKASGGSGELRAHHIMQTRQSRT